MAFRLVYSLQLTTGITDLRAQLLDPAGANVGGVISTGFTADLGGGQYLWDYSAFPDGHYGAVAFYRASAPGTRWIHAINPQEAENLDVKVSSRSSHTAADIWSASTRTLTSFGSLVADVAAAVWAAAVRTLTSFGIAGGIEYTYTLTSTGGGPIADATLWFATDATISNVVWFGATDSFGVARDANGNKPRLTPGTYYIRASKTGYGFPIDVEVVG